MIPEMECFFNGAWESGSSSSASSLFVSNTEEKVLSLSIPLPSLEDSSGHPGM